MKTTIYLSILLLYLCFSCNKATNKEDVKQTEQLNYSDSMQGNFSGNGKIYACYVNKSEDKNCIEFSDSDIPRILTNYWLSPRLINEGDLNNDSKDEIGAIVMTEPEMGTWHKYHVWTLQNGKWENLIEPFDIFIGSDLNIEDLVKIDSINKNNVIIRFNEWEDEGIITKEKSVKMKF